MATDSHRPVPRHAVHVEGLTRCFDGRAVIDDLRLDIAPGEFVALLGRPGCGKTTLLRVLAGLDREIRGTALVPRRRAVTCQAPRLTPWRKVWRNVLPGRTERALAEGALDEVGLGHRSGAWPRTLSAGEVRRTALARALVQEPELLLLDEPFDTLDTATRTQARFLVGELWRRRGCAVLLATDDAEDAVLLADRVLVMDGGRIAHERRVGLDRPRDITDPRLAALRGHLLERLDAPPRPRSHLPVAPPPPSAPAPAPAPAPGRDSGRLGRSVRPGPLREA